jgi:hypothetical protein
LAACHIARGADDDTEAELKKVGGRFERYFENAAGTTFHAVKEVIGNQSSVTTYDDAGNIVEAHGSTIKVEKRGPVRIFSYFNLVVTAGPDKGHTEAGTNSYIYRIDDDTMTEVWGLLEGDPNPPRMFVWRRIKETKR